MTAAPVTPDGSDKKEKEPKTRHVAGYDKNVPDGAPQNTVGTLASTTAGLSFAGVGNGDYGYSPSVAPPDTNGAVGATQYMQWVNSDFAIFSKSTGALLLGPKAGNTLWAGFGGGCQNNNDGDPVVEYDRLANRWVVTQFSVSTTPYLECVAVSTTSDATGTWYRYAFTQPYFNDYPKMSVWPDGYYITYDMFNGNTYVGPRVCAMDRSKMLTGAAATQVCYQLSSSYSTILPSDLDGSTLPPTGSPNYVLGLGGSSSLRLWKFQPNFATPSSSTLTGPTSIAVASYSLGCGGGACVPQPSTTTKLDALGDRLMFRLAYRNRGGIESMVVSHAITSGSTVGVRWYELRIASGAVSVYQQSTFAPDSTYRWMSSIAMDKQGNIALGYSASSSTLRPSIRYTGRLVTDTLNTMQAENTAKAGVGSQTGGLDRWGDYSAMTVDPVDDCTFWYTNEYLKSSGSFNWSTWISSFKFPGCV
jgi:hypothetical protein